eukprot:scaffold2363_cov159-Amphora_coffeaeformis.AAC.16
MKAKQAVDSVDAEKWAATTVKERLHLLYTVRENMIQHVDELNAAVAKSRNKLGNVRSDDPHPYNGNSVALGSSVTFANNLATAIDLYESLQKTGQLLQPISVTKVEAAENLYDAHVFPLTYKESFMFPTQKMILRIAGEEPPVVQNPLDKPPGIIAILGAGNTGSSVELIKSLFFDNRVVVHKAHPLNAESDKMWETILKPLYDHKALSTCDPDDGPALCKDARISKVFFTGSCGTAKMIQKNSVSPLIAECGGVNPVVVVPGDKPWTAAELEHQAMHIATIGKYLGGAVCARPQLVVTCKNWPQRQEFLDCMVRALRDGTPGVSSWYPDSENRFAKFQQEHTNSTVIEPESGKHGKQSRVLWIPDVSETDYVCKNEAFCQVFAETALDTNHIASEFLPAASEFCNNKLFGSLCATILVDDATLKSHEQAVSQAITDLRYGSIAINGNAALVWTLAHLVWGGLDTESGPIESGRGNFGNPFGYHNAVKSIVYDKFVTPTHPIQKNNAVFEQTLRGLVTVALQPSWYNHFAFVFKAIYGSFKSKDF